MQVRRRIDVSGIVQGVGFRPYVFRLATTSELVGSVCNTSEGVAIELQGREEAVREFLTRLPEGAPPLSRITQISVREIPCNHDREFVIVGSEHRSSVRTLITPDVALCEDCLCELFDPSNRRYRYPFINCTNCGPRFTITRGVPYDRLRTSMAVFKMCSDCQAEYDDPRDRRFHAQPNACWKCGPRLEVWNADGTAVRYCDPVAEAVSRLRFGQVVAVKGIGGFHLAVDATNASA